MSFLDFLLGQKKKTSASVAKDRLQLILINERGSGERSPDFLPQMQQELIAVISKYVTINPEDIKINLDKQDSLEVLELEVKIDKQQANR